MLAPTAIDLSASFNPPKIELTHLSVEYLDEWKLFGIDYSGKEYELIIDKDDWRRLEKIGTLYEKSFDVYRLELGENIRLVDHWLSGTHKLIDWKIQ